jgi:hypothetical protein
MSGIDTGAIFNASRRRVLALIREDAKTALFQRMDDILKRDAEQVAAAGDGLVDNPEYPGFSHDFWAGCFLDAKVVI